MSQRACLVCGSAYGPSKLPGLIACTRCTFTSADVELSHDQLKALYTANYFSGEEYKDYVADREIIEKQFRLRLRKVLQHLPPDRRNHIFEIGCAYGFFLNVAQEHFKTVAGIDISDDAIRHARETLRLPAVVGDYLDYAHAETPDTICLWDTIEHLERPDLYVEKASDSLKTGGLIAITTGDIGSTVAKLRGPKWRQIHPPTHLHYFSHATLAQLLDRYGFDIAYRGSDGMYRSVDTMAYILLTIKRRNEGLYRFLKAAHLLDWHAYLNLYDIVFYVGLKR
jgi:2-polyprenyl-3-methyl-5-hydroxy-6-metoxy-1,4-benzoquinol methylase